MRLEGSERGRAGGRRLRRAGGSVSCMMDSCAHGLEGGREGRKGREGGREGGKEGGPSEGLDRYFGGKAGSSAWMNVEGEEGREEERADS